MTNVVNNTQNISSTPSPPPSLTTNSSGLKKNTTTTRVASRGSSGASGGNGSQACAACKYQRRKCASDCPLAPYFPAEKQKDFLNAHKLFGVSNILKVLKNVAPFQKDNAMKTLIFEANIRAEDPVGGCYRVILNLHRQINLYQAELQFVYGEIFRAQAAAIQEQRNINATTNSTVSFDLLPLHDLYEYNRSNSIYIGEGSSSQIVKGKELECFSSDEEFETKTIMRGSNGKQSFAEHEDVKPHFGNFHNYKGKGAATELSDDKAETSKNRDIKERDNFEEVVDNRYIEEKVVEIQAAKTKGKSTGRRESKEEEEILENNQLVNREHHGSDDEVEIQNKERNSQTEGSSPSKEQQENPKENQTLKIVVVITTSDKEESSTHDISVLINPPLKTQNVFQSIADDTRQFEEEEEQEQNTENTISEDIVPGPN
ncbi:uncharacterized protein LOC132031574 [Lycium ferocissimum]|uniref:uncharacterized protein LOC132031574 n=1 Tax=Lycium ferocissimum TaxID=112874 RepID=UPI00281597FC|nr:uncharacterized protein LOC132031574 [Lycium ferocissimum]